MFNRLVSTIVLASFFVSTTLRAEEVTNQGVLARAKPVLESGEVDPGKVVSPMKKGQKAPYTGVLLAPQSVASVIAELEEVPEKIKIEVRKATAEEKVNCDLRVDNAAAKCSADKASLRATITANEATIKAYEEKTKKLEAQQTNPLAWIGVGFAGGVAVTLLTVFAVSSATK